MRTLTWGPYSVRHKESWLYFLNALKNKIKGSPVLWTHEIQGGQHMISMKKQRFPIVVP